MWNSMVKPKNAVPRQSRTAATTGDKIALLPPTAWSCLVKLRAGPHAAVRPPLRAGGPPYERPADTPSSPVSVRERGTQRRKTHGSGAGTAPHPPREEVVRSRDNKRSACATGLTQVCQDGTAHHPPQQDLCYGGGLQCGVRGNSDAVHSAHTLRLHARYEDVP